MAAFLNKQEAKSLVKQNWFQKLKSNLETTEYLLTEYWRFV